MPPRRLRDPFRLTLLWSLLSHSRAEAPQHDGMGGRFHGSSGLLIHSPSSSVGTVRYDVANDSFDILRVQSKATAFPIAGEMARCATARRSSGERVSAATLVPRVVRPTSVPRELNSSYARCAVRKLGRVAPRAARPSGPVHRVGMHQSRSCIRRGSESATVRRRRRSDRCRSKTRVGSLSSDARFVGAHWR